MKSLRLIEEIVKFIAEMKKNDICNSDHNFMKVKFITVHFFKYVYVRSIRFYFFKELEFLVDNSEQAAEDFSVQLHKLDFGPTQIMEIRVNFWRNVLWKIKLKIAFCLKQLINVIASVSVLEEKLLHFILRW